MGFKPLSQSRPQSCYLTDDHQSELKFVSKQSNHSLAELEKVMFSENLENLSLGSHSQKYAKCDDFICFSLTEYKPHAHIAIVLQNN